MAMAGNGSRAGSTRSTGGSTTAAKPAMTQKEKWAARAEKRRQQAERAEAEAKRLYDENRRPSDTAFWTQPGLGRQRDKARARIERSFEATRRAERLRERASNLDRMATRNKGDAERQRQSQREAWSGKVGDRIRSRLYGPGVVTRVNRKTVTYMTDNGYKTNIDKAWIY
jgi:hypothetical protein